MSQWLGFGLAVGSTMCSASGYTLQKIAHNRHHAAMVLQNGGGKQAGTGGRRDGNGVGPGAARGASAGSGGGGGDGAGVGTRGDGERKANGVASGAAKSHRGSYVASPTSPDSAARGSASHLGDVVSDPGDHSAEPHSVRAGSLAVNGNASGAAPGAPQSRPGSDAALSIAVPAAGDQSSSAIDLRPSPRASDATGITVPLPSGAAPVRALFVGVVRGFAGAVALAARLLVIRI